MRRSSESRRILRKNPRGSEERYRPREEGERSSEHEGRATMRGRDPEGEESKEERHEHEGVVKKGKESRR
jgi:hypothetical protein